MPQQPASSPPHVAFQVFLDGILAAVRSVFFYVLVGNYVGMGALAHEVGFSFWWMALSHAADLGGAGAGHPDLDLTTASLCEVALAVTLIERALPADGGGDPAGHASIPASASAICCCRCISPRSASGSKACGSCR